MTKRKRNMWGAEWRDRLLTADEIDAMPPPEGLSSEEGDEDG